ncbi:MAG: lysylphosphatidylglycerol synthase transmembrane domain-containing protein [Paenibacillaceae bacterium]
MRKNLISIFLLLALIITIYFSITLSQLEIAMNMFSLNSFMICFLIYFVSNILRSTRYYLVIGDPQLTWFKLLPVIMQYQFFVRIFPLKSGEFSLLYLLRKHRNINIEQSANSLLYVKVVDLISILFLFLSFYVTHITTTNNNIANIFVLIGILILNIMITALFMKYYVPVFEFMKELIKKRTWKFLKYNLVNNILSYKRDLSLKEILLISINTSAIWISLYVLLLYLIKGSISIPINEQIDAITFSFIGNTLPINGIGGFGTQEAAWTIGFMQKGVEYSLSLLTGVYANVISFLYSAIFGVAGWFYLYRTKKDKKDK